MTRLLFIAISLVSISCINRSKSSAPNFPYNLKKVTNKIKLPNELDEISGLAYVGSNILYCINDEKGKIYVLNVKENEILSEIEFGKNQDYEGITVVENIVYVAKNTGNLYEVKGLKEGNVTTKKIEGFLNSDNDVEGLCYSEELNALFLACKDRPGKQKDDFKGSKAVYKFDLSTGKVEEEPQFLINLDAVRDLKRSGNTQRLYDKFLEKSGKGNATFNPSGIAIHPITKRVYILSSVGNTLVVLNSDGALHTAVHLDGDKFKQPEGITFDELGNMYISNEARGGKANVLFFEYNKVN